MTSFIKKIECLATWVKVKDANGEWLGKVLRLCYEICVNAVFQSIINICASLLLGAFAFKDGILNKVFLMPFSVIYLGFIVIFLISNLHRKGRNNTIRGYELSFLRISNALQEEYMNNMKFHQAISEKSLDNMIRYYEEHDTYTDICFRTCNAVENLLQEISGKQTFRVATFLRKIETPNEYGMNGFSPLEPVPESYGKSFPINLAKGKHARKAKCHTHKKPFINPRTEPIILLGDEVKKSYLDFNDSHPTKLHISIPCSVNGEVVAVMQITSYDENALGNKGDIQVFIKTVLVLFTAFLKVAYSHQLQHETLTAAIKSET